MTSRIQAFLAKARRHLADDAKDRADGVMPCRCVMIETEDVRAIVEAMNDHEQEPSGENPSLRVPSELLLLLGHPLMGPAITKFARDVQAALNEKPRCYACPMHPWTGGDGWKLVPEEPTEHMLSLARFYRNECAKEGREVKDEVLYVSMVAQAPNPPQQRGAD